MAPSLLCAEESLVCFDETVDNELRNTEWNQQINRTLNQNYSFPHGGFLLIEFPLQSEEGLALMFEKEQVHLPREDYLKRLQNGDLDSGIRRDAIDWIRKVHGIYNFGPLSAYLSINYLDRFLSVYELPRGKSWTMQLLAVACLSLGAKMEESKMPFSLDLQVGEPKFIFEAKTIQRMELLVLSTLKWRMQSVTPFSFIDYFLTKINDGQPPRLLISQSFELFLSTIRGIEILEFRPSEFAAAVAIHVSSSGGMPAVELDKFTSYFTQTVDKGRVLKCIGVIQEVALISATIKAPSSSLSSVPQSPNGVLEAACLSYKSDESTDGSSTHFSQTSQSKRRKLN